MKLLTPIFIFLLVFSISAQCQFKTQTNSNKKTITPLKNNTFEIKELTKNNVLLYKGILSSVKPEIRSGKYYFYYETGEIEATGKYNQDIPFGNWVYYSKLQDTLRSIDYSKVLNFLVKEDTLFPTGKDNTVEDSVFFIVERMPTYKGQDPTGSFNEYLTDNIVIPIYASKLNIEGKVMVQFLVDKNGCVRNPLIVYGTYPDLNMEALRLISESPPWEPGYQNNNPKNVLFTWTINFNSENQTQDYNPKLILDHKGEIKQGEILEYMDSIPEAYVHMLDGNQVKVFFNRRGRACSYKESEFYRIGKFSKENRQFEGQIFDYSQDKRIIFTGTIFNGSLNDSAKIYFKNGKLEAEGNYKDNKKDGFWKIYYPNGNLKFLLEYGEKIRLIEYYSKSGKEIVKNGNGSFVWKIVNYSISKVNCQVRDGYRIGIWESSNLKEEYDVYGNFISGLMKLNGITYRSTQYEYYFFELSELPTKKKKSKRNEIIFQKEL